VATLSYYFAPVIITVACAILFRERLTGRQWICFVMSTLGLAMITGVGLKNGGTDHIGILLGLGAAVLYATVVLLNKFIQGVAGVQRTFLQFAAALLTLLPYVLLTSGFTLGNLDASGWISLLVVGVVHSGIAYCLYFSALKDIPGQEAAILSYIDPLVAVAVSVFVLGEQLTALQLIGGILILGFTLYNEIK
jgi:drug/metabolite transporter (DMT)-like permease